MARYPYLGTYARLYTQYIDVTDNAYKSLVAYPANSYEMIIGPGQASSLSIPPADGEWGAALSSQAEAAAEQSSASASPRARKAGRSS